MIVVHDPGDDRPQEWRVALVEGRQGGVIAGLDSRHELFVGRVSRGETVDLLVVEFVEHGGLVG